MMQLIMGLAGHRTFLQNVVKGRIHLLTKFNNAYFSLFLLLCQGNHFMDTFCGFRVSIPFFPVIGFYIISRYFIMMLMNCMFLMFVTAMVMAAVSCASPHKNC